MKLTQDEIRRIARREARSAVQSGGGTYAGGVSEAWIAENFVSKDFFNRIFTIHAEDSDVVLPNDTETAIESIEAKAGLWTEQFISTLGMGDGGGGGGVTMLSLLDDVLINESTLDDGQALVYDAANQMWVNGTAGLSDYLPLTGGTMKSTAVVGNLNADMLDGFHASSLFTYLSCSTNGTLSATIGGVSKQVTIYAYNSDMLDSYHASSLFEDFSNNGNMVDIQIGGTSKSLTVDYASRAGKLNTGSTYTAWGQTYWSNGLPVTINGDISNTGHIKPSSDITYDVGTDRLRYDNIYARFVRAYGTAPAVYAGVSESYFTALHYNSTNNYRGIYDKYQNTEGWLLRFDGTDTYLLRGTTKVSRLQIGSIVIEEDTTNSGLRIVGAGLYADTYISALGVSSSGSSGGASSLSLLDDVSLSNPANGQSLVYRNGMWVNETVSGGGSTGVTALSQLTDTSIGTPYSGQLLRYNGTSWVNSYIALGDLSNVSLSSPYSGQFLMYSGYYWVNASIGVKISSSQTLYSNTSGIIDLSSQGFLPLSGGEMTGSIVMPASDSYSISPKTPNYGYVGTSTNYFWRMYSYAFFSKDGGFHHGSMNSDSYVLLAGGGYKAISDFDVSNAVMKNTTEMQVLQGKLVVSNSNNAEFSVCKNINASNARLSLHWSASDNRGLYDDGASRWLLCFDGSNTTMGGGNITAVNGAFTPASDIRKKNVLDYVEPDIIDLSRLPIIRYTWKDGGDDKIHLGTVAQAVDVNFHELVYGDYSTAFSLDYAALGTIGAITAAREIIRLKDRVAELEKTINELKAA